MTAYNPEYDKVMRMHAQTGAIANGFVYLPHEAAWLAEYLYELAMFPNGKYNDQVDSTSQALAWTKQRPAGWAVMEFYRRQAERIGKSTPSIRVRLKPPTCISTLYTFDGRKILPEADGTFELSLEDAKPYLAAGWQRV